MRQFPPRVCLAGSISSRRLIERTPLAGGAGVGAEWEAVTALPDAGAPDGTRASSFRDSSPDAWTGSGPERTTRSTTKKMTPTATPPSDAQVQGERSHSGAPDD